MKYLIIFVSFLYLLNVSCTDTFDCAEPLPNDRGGINFYIYNKPNGFNLIGKFGAIYDSDQVNFIKADSTEASRFNINSNGKISFDHIEGMYEYDSSTNRHVVIKNEIERSYRLYLPDTNFTSNYDIDTIIVKYLLNEDDDMCPRVWYEYFDLTYNGNYYNKGSYDDNRFNFYKFPE